MNHPTHDEVSNLKEKSLELKKKIRKLNAENGALKAQIRELIDAQRMLAHDLKTPLTGIKLTIETIIETFDTYPMEKIPVQLGKVVTLADKMGKIVRYIIEQDRQNNATDAEHLNALNIKALLESCVSQLEPAATKKEIAISLNPLGIEDCQVLGDEPLLDAVICNVLSNAVKYSPQATSIEIWCETQAQTLTINIKDQGQGLESYEIAQLFNAYKPLSAKPTNNESQTGLGLYISQRMMQKMNGSISAYSDGKDKGSTFQIRIPLTTIPIQIG